MLNQVNRSSHTWLPPTLNMVGILSYYAYIINIITKNMSVLHKLSLKIINFLSIFINSQRIKNILLMQNNVKRTYGTLTDSFLPLWKLRQRVKSVKRLPEVWDPIRYSKFLGSWVVCLSSILEFTHSDGILDCQKGWNYNGTPWLYPLLTDMMAYLPQLP